MPIEERICEEHGLQYDHLVGSGAFKDTHKVFDANGQSLALKVCNSQNSPARLAREVDAMIACNHKNIARLVKAESFRNGGVEHFFMLEEFIDGVTIESQLEESLLRRDEAISLTQSVIAAISHMQGIGLVHRDLKPANIILRQDSQEAVVIDFGIVRNLGATSITKTFIAQGPGTPHFAPPEQLNNEKHLIDWRADQFALGITVSVAMTGLHPYAASDDDPVGEVVELAARRQGPSERFVEWALLNDLEPLVAMVRPWPANRFRTPSALSAAWAVI